MRWRRAARRTRGGVAAAFAALALLAGSACAPAGDEAARARPESTLVWGVNVQPDYLNPVVMASGFSRQICDLLFLRLADFGPPPELEFEPMLAESWELSGDRRTLTYHLRTDVVWDDGVPTTAHDVKFTFDTISNPDVPYPSRSQLRNIASCEVVDEWTVRFRFSRPSWEPIYDTRFHVVPRHLLASVAPDEWLGAEFGRHPVGNGRWRFVEWVPEDRVVLEASPRSPWPRPGFDRVVFRIIPEDTTLRTELLTGGVDVYDRFPHRYYREDSRNPDLLFLEIPDRTYVYIGWNYRNPLFRDRRVREALTLATDRRTIVDAFRAGFGAVVAVPVFAEHRAFNPNVEPLPFDPQRAARLLDEAGWTGRDVDGVRMKGGKRFEFTFMLIAKNEISEEIATMTQEEFGKLGIAVETEFYEWTVFLEKERAKDFDALILARSSELILDPEDVFHSRAIDGRYNTISFSDPVIDSLIDLARTIPDREERKKVWWRFQEKMHELRAITVLYTGKAAYPVRRDRVANPVMDVRGPLVRLHEWRPAGGDA